MVRSDYREDGQEVPAYLARGSDRLFRALREWANDPDLRKVSQHIFKKTPIQHCKFRICCEKIVDHL